MTATDAPHDSRLPAVPAARVAVVGDVGGHVAQLRRLLEKLGVVFDLPAKHAVSGAGWADVSLSWPEGLLIVQAGDLIHRGPDSLGVVVLVDRLLREGRWVQVAGNHEQLYVRPATFHWPETIPDEAIRMLRAWWSEGLMVAATAITSDAGPAAGPNAGPAGGGGRGVVVVHGGVTAGFWHEVLGAPDSAEETAAAINDLRGTHVLWRPGLMLGGQPSLSAGPVWAEAGHEVYASWYLAAQRGLVCGFDQAHGHSSAFTWSRRRWHAPAPLLPHLRADTRRSHVRFRLGDATFTGIDPGHEHAPARTYAPLLLAPNS